MENLNANRSSHPAPNNRIRFKRTDELVAMVRSIVIDYHKEHGEELDRAQLRQISTKLLVAIEEGARAIPLSRVRLR